MKTLFITGFILYAIWVAVYFSYGYISRRRTKGSQMKTKEPASAAGQEDIIGKSTFELCHSLPEASSAEKRAKAHENDDIFAASNSAKMPAELSGEALEEAFLHHEEDPELMDFSVTLEYEDAAATFGEEEEEESWLPGGVSLAEGVTFEEIGVAVHTVVHHQGATLPEKEEAGGVLLEIRQSDLFEQVVQSAPGREDLVSELMSLHLAGYYRRLKEESGAAGSHVRQAPPDFDMKDFV